MSIQTEHQRSLINLELFFEQFSVSPKKKGLNSSAMKISPFFALLASQTAARETEERAPAKEKVPFDEALQILGKVLT